MGHVALVALLKMPIYSVLSSSRVISVHLEIRLQWLHRRVPGCQVCLVDLATSAGAWLSSVLGGPGYIGGCLVVKCAWWTWLHRRVPGCQVCLVDLATSAGAWLSSVLGGPGYIGGCLVVKCAWWTWLHRRVPGCQVCLMDLAAWLGAGMVAPPLTLRAHAPCFFMPNQTVQHVETTSFACLCTSCTSF